MKVKKVTSGKYRLVMSDLEFHKLHTVLDGMRMSQMALVSPEDDGAILLALWRAFDDTVIENEE